MSQAESKFAATLARYEPVLGGATRSRNKIVHVRRSAIRKRKG